MQTVTIENAEANLSRLIALAERGEEIVISRGMKPVVRLVTVEEPPKERKPGMFKGELELGPAFFEPLPPEELDLWE